MKNNKVYEKEKKNLELANNDKIDNNDEIEIILKDCSKLIYKVDINKKNIKNDINKHIAEELNKYFNNNDINKSFNYKIYCTHYKTPGRLWILLGKKFNGKYCSLMIGQSEDIRKEIEFNLNKMYDEEFDINNKDKDIHEEINLISGEPYKYKEKSKKSTI